EELEEAALSAAVRAEQQRQAGSEIERFTLHVERTRGAAQRPSGRAVVPKADATRLDERTPMLTHATPRAPLASRTLVGLVFVIATPRSSSRRRHRDGAAPSRSRPVRDRPAPPGESGEERAGARGARPPAGARRPPRRVPPSRRTARLRPGSAQARDAAPIPRWPRAAEAHPARPRRCLDRAARRARSREALARPERSHPRCNVAWRCRAGSGATATAGAGQATPPPG